MTLLRLDYQSLIDASKLHEYKGRSQVKEDKENKEEAEKKKKKEQKRMVILDCNENKRIYMERMR